MSLCARMFAVVSICAVSLPAVATDQGQYGNVPDNIRSWFKSVMSPKGVPCCDVADGHRTDYNMRADEYWVPIDGEWTPVPAEALPDTSPPDETVNVPPAETIATLVTVPSTSTAPPLDTVKSWAVPPAEMVAEPPADTKKKAAEPATSSTPPLKTPM